MPARFVVSLTPSFQRDLDTSPRRARRRSSRPVRRLETNPNGPPPRIKKLKGTGVSQWRLELWPCRVRYDIFREDVVLYRVRHRREIARD